MSDQTTERPKTEKPKAHQPKVHDIRLHLHIAENDLNVKLNQVKKFLDKRDPVRITLQLRGRENSRPESALEFMGGIIERLAENGTPSKPPQRGERDVRVLLNPAVKKK